MERIALFKFNIIIIIIIIIINIINIIIIIINIIIYYYYYLLLILQVICNDDLRSVIYVFIWLFTRCNLNSFMIKLVLLLNFYSGFYLLSILTCFFFLIFRNVF